MYFHKLGSIKYLKYLEKIPQELFGTSPGYETKLSRTIGSDFSRKIVLCKGLTQT